MYTSQELAITPASVFETSKLPLIMETYASESQLNPSTKLYQTPKKKTKIKTKKGQRRMFVDNDDDDDYSDDDDDDDDDDYGDDESTESDADYFTPLKNVASGSKIKFKVNTRKYKIKSTNEPLRKPLDSRFSSIEGVRVSGSYHVAESKSHRFVFRGVYLNS